MIAGGPAPRLEPAGTGNGEAFDTSAPLCRRVWLPARPPPFQGGQAGSTPARATASPCRLARPRILPSQGRDAGSNPARVANGPVVQVDGHRSTKSVHGCSNHPGVSNASGAGAQSPFIRAARSDRHRSLVRASGQAERRQPDTLEIAGSIPASLTEGEPAGLPAPPRKRMAPRVWRSNRPPSSTGPGSSTKRVQRAVTWPATPDEPGPFTWRVARAVTRSGC